MHLFGSRFVTMRALKMNWIDFLNTGGVVVLVTTISNAIVKGLERRRNYKKALNAISDIYDVFNRVIDDSNANRVLVLKSSNGGSRPTIGVNLYVSVLHEMSTRGVDQIKAQYQSIHIDETYIRLLQRLTEKKEFEIYTSEIEPGSFLRLTYDKEQLKRVYMFEIKGNGDNYYFGSFSTQAQEFTDNDRLAFRLAIDKLRKIFANEK